MRTLDYDIVIVGSGAGGGTVAKELAPLCQKGMRIALLEWGGRFNDHDNTRSEVEMAQKYYFESGGVQNSGQEMTFALAKAVGGSTTVYTGTSLVLPDEILEKKWAVPGLTSVDLKPRFQKYLKENNVHLLDKSLINENNQLFYNACNKLGFKPSQFPVNVKNCQGLGTCNLGCAVHAKQGTHVVQIPSAEKQGVEVVSFCRVDKIEENCVRATVLPPEHGLEASPWPCGEYSIRTKKIILCAGAIHTPALLLKSFGSFHHALGKYFTCHPALILVAQHDREINNTFGHPKSYYCEDFMHSHGVLLETCMYFPFTLAKNLVGFGPDVDDLMSHFNHLQMILVLIMDHARKENGITIDRQGNPIIHYKFNSQDIAAFIKGIRESARIFFAAGAKRIHAPACKSFFIEARQAAQLDQLINQEEFKLGKMSIASAHLMGGCRMGENPQEAITDSWGRVNGKKDLYVADASLFPNSSGVNPYLTVMALADRVAEAVIHDYRKGL
ncbi:MAG: GMC family oxidoreductase [Bdellovibrio sp.]|nr:GMC family oxidoreductase [Bdellovibrio sp.]